MSDTSILKARRYRLDEQIAAGGFGEIWRGTDVTLDRTVAIKLLRPACAQDPATVARFRAEARHAAALCHPNIAAVHDFCEPPPPEAPFLVMEYVAGPSLATLLAVGPLSAAQTMRVVSDTAFGLAAAHRAGLVHRDVKPGNLLLDRHGRVKITDFGISHATGSVPLTATGMLMGTPAYMAPERVVGARGTSASDIYSLGVVAYHAVTGTLPFTGSPLDVATAHRALPMPPLPDAVPREVTAFIAQLTNKDPAARPADALVIAQRARRLWEQLSASAETRAKPPRRRAVVVGIHLAGTPSVAAPYYATAMPRTPVIARPSRPHIAAALTDPVRAPQTATPAAHDQDAVNGRAWKDHRQRPDDALARQRNKHGHDAPRDQRRHH